MQRVLLTLRFPPLEHQCGPAAAVEGQHNSGVIKWFDGTGAGAFNSSTLEVAADSNWVSMSPYRSYSS